MESRAASEVRRPSVLFVCTANICRSPMAAALFRARLREEVPEWRAWKIGSAGTWGLDGEPAARYSQAAMARRGLDISTHRARTVTAELLAQYDLVLTMEAGQKEALQIEFPELANRVFMLSEMEGQARPVEDPYGSSDPAAYESTAEKIDQMLAKGMSRIVAMVKAKYVK